MFVIMAYKEPTVLYYNYEYDYNEYIIHDFSYYKNTAHQFNSYTEGINWLQLHPDIKNKSYLEGFIFTVGELNYNPISKNNKLLFMNYIEN